MYHRIADVEVDPWDLAVSPSNFEQHLQVLRKFDVISVEQLVSKLYKRSFAFKNVCLTFDDAYSDNYQAAKPLLESYKQPATFFVPTDYIGTGKQFWWDELTMIFLTYEKLPRLLEVTVDNTQYVFEIGNEGLLDKGDLEKHKLWRWLEEPPTIRTKVFLKVWELIRPLYGVSLEGTMTSIKEWAGCSWLNEEFNAITIAQLKDLGEHPLIDIGLHTASHPALKFQAHEIQQKEISECKRFLELNCKNTVNAIAFPYGDYNTSTLHIAKNEGLSAAFSTDSKPVSTRSNIYELGRFQVKNWNGDEFEKQLYSWIKG
ncbi:MAG TPA: polysaccharide deacetylase family protein [Chitinophagaceae bacterium]|nr:polysaccharide deacetylase family protein [Chitinophagaceae bacterium]